MAAAKNTTRTNTPTEQNKEDNSLVLYRLEKVEEAVKENTRQLAGAQNITKSDLADFKASIFERFDEKNASLQSQINEKADASDVKDIKGLVKALGTVFTTVIGGLVLYYLTYGRK